jgi:hypothetical protein
MTTYRVLLPHPLESRLLMMHVHGEWRLPEWEEPARPSWQVTDHVNRAVAARFGIETTVLRCVRVRTDPVSRRDVRIYELENHSAAHDVIPSSTWIGRGELSLLPIGDADSRELMAEWFSRDAGELPVRGAPWMRRGWYVEALAWMTARLREENMYSRGTPEQLRGSERSFVMRCQTDHGAFYFKAVPPVFGHEPELNRWLADRYPEHFPEVIAIDTVRGWLLERAVPSDAMPLDEVREEEEWYQAVRRLAEIQVECAARASELIELGCPERDLEILARRTPRMCADGAAMLLGEACGLSRAEIDRIAALAPTLLALGEELASYGIPNSIEHGSLTAGKVLSALGGPLFLDWSCSSLSHPFFSVSNLMTQAISQLPATSRESRRRLRDSYLAPWADVASSDKLVRAFEIARVLAPMHEAAFAYAELIPSVGYRWEVECAVPDGVRAALRLLADSDSPVSIAS